MNNNQKCTNANNHNTAAIKITNKQIAFMFKSYKRNSKNKLAWACTV